MLDAVPGCCAARDVGAARPFDYGVHTLLLLQAVARPHSVPKGTGDDSLLHAYKRDMSDAYGSGLPAGFSVPASFIPELEQKRERTTSFGLDTLARFCAGCKHKAAVGTGSSRGASGWRECQAATCRCSKAIDRVRDSGGMLSNASSTAERGTAYAARTEVFGQESEGPDLELADMKRQQKVLEARLHDMEKQVTSKTDEFSRRKLDLNEYIQERTRTLGKDAPDDKRIQAYKKQLSGLARQLMAATGKLDLLKMQIQDSKRAISKLSSQKPGSVVRFANSGIDSESPHMTAATLSPRPTENVQSTVAMRRQGLPSSSPSPRGSYVKKNGRVSTPETARRDGGEAGLRRSKTHFEPDYLFQKKAAFAGLCQEFLSKKDQRSFDAVYQMMLSLSDEQVVQLLQTVSPQTRRAISTWPRESQDAASLAQVRQEQVDRLLSGPVVLETFRRAGPPAHGVRPKRNISPGLVLRNYGGDSPLPPPVALP